ncbi:DsrE family protein [Microbulbifer salipaludis]|uniref:DsrE family protein n=1 Tax=Microbulbifer salipaludis TaxID=187980 RepID=A0ABS3E4I2_9GAMM|nr:DsrE family protein [Microbulbifer salipaludis]MBN8430209.1 DsrE family protein [Microbulbifer salipaludis]
MKTPVGILLALLFIAPLTLSAEFSKGPVITNYGGVAGVKQTVPLKGHEQFKVVFDVADQGDKDKANRRFENLARFLNMQARAGVPPEQIALALVVHGKAGFDLLSNPQFEKKFGIKNPNAPLLKALQEQGVTIHLCGQSAAYYGIENAHLLPGINMALSAMTANALLQQQGYTLNPF